MLVIDVTIYTYFFTLLTTLKIKIVLFFAVFKKILTILQRVSKNTNN